MPGVPAAGGRCCVIAHVRCTDPGEEGLKARGAVQSDLLPGCGFICCWKLLMFKYQKRGGACRAKQGIFSVPLAASQVGTGCSISGWEGNQHSVPLPSGLSPPRVLPPAGKPSPVPASWLRGVFPFILNTSQLCFLSQQHME